MLFVSLCVFQWSLVTQCWDFDQSCFLLIVYRLILHSDMSTAENRQGFSPSPSPSPKPRSHSSSSGDKKSRFPLFRRDKEKRRSKKDSVSKAEQDATSEALRKPTSPHSQRKNAAVVKVYFGDELEEDVGRSSRKSSITEDNYRPDTAASYRSGTPASLMDILDNDGDSYFEGTPLSRQLEEIQRRLHQLDYETDSKHSQDMGLQEVAKLLEVSLERAKHLEGYRWVRSASSSDLLAEEMKPEYKRVNPNVAMRLMELHNGIQKLEMMGGGLKKRLHHYSKAQKSSEVMRQRIHQLEREKDELLKENSELRLRTGSSTDLDIADLQHENAKLRDALHEQQRQLEGHKIDTRQQKEKLVLKLFEIECLNIKGNEHSLEKDFLALEHEQIFWKTQVSSRRPRSTSPEPVGGPGKISHRLKQAEAELQMQKAKMKQLELQNIQARSLVSSLLDQRLDLEKQLDDIKSRQSVNSSADLPHHSIHSIGITSSEVGVLRSKNASLQRDVEELKTQTARLKVVTLEKEQLSQQLSEKSKDMQALQDLVQHHEEENDKLSAKLESLQAASEEVRRLQLDLQHVQHERDEFNAATHRLQQRQGQLELELSDAYEKVGLSQKEAIDMKIALQEYQLDQDTREQELQRLTSLVTQQESVSVENKSLTEKVNEMKSLMQKQDIDLYQLQEDLCSKDNSLEETTKQMQDSEQRMMELQREFEKLEEERSELQDKLKASQSQADGQCAELQKKLDGALEEKETLRAETDNLRKRLFSLTEDLSNLLADKRILEKKVEALSVASPEMMQQRAELLVSRERAEQELQDTKKALEASLKNVMEIESEQKHLQQQLTSSQDRLDKAVKDRDSAVAEMESLKLELEKVRSTAVAKEAYAGQVAMDLEVARKQVDQLSKQLSDLQREKGKMEVTVKDDDRRIQELMQRSESSEAALKKLTSDEVPSYLKQISELSVDKMKISGEVSVLSTKLENAVKDNERLSSYVQELRQDLAAKSSEYHDLSSSHDRELKAERQEAYHLQQQMKKLEDRESTVRMERDQFAREVSRVQEQLKVSVEEVSKLQKHQEEASLVHAKMRSEYEDMEKRNKRLIEELSRAESKISTLQSRVQEAESSGADSNEIATQLDLARKEAGSLREKLVVVEATNEELRAKLEAAEKHYKQRDSDYKNLGKSIEGMLNSSSQMKADNVELLELLRKAHEEIAPTKEHDDAFRHLQEDNERLEKQVSVLGQWNEKHQQEIDQLEESCQQLRKMHKEAVERMAEEKERQLGMLRKELQEVETECVRLRRRLQGEAFEEYRTKLQTQQTLLLHISEQNTSLQAHIDTLMQRIVEMGGDPPSPPAMTFSAPESMDLEDSYSGVSDPSPTDRESRDKAKEKGKTKDKRKSWSKRSRSATPTSQRSTAIEEPANGDLHAATELEDLHAENKFLREKLRELQEDLFKHAAAKS